MGEYAKSFISMSATESLRPPEPAIDRKQEIGKYNIPLISRSVFDEGYGRRIAVVDSDGDSAQTLTWLKREMPPGFDFIVADSTVESWAGIKPEMLQIRGPRLQQFYDEFAERIDWSDLLARDQSFRRFVDEITS